MFRMNVFEEYVVGVRFDVYSFIALSVNSLVHVGG